MNQDGYKALFLEEAFELLAESGSVLLDFEREPNNVDIINKLFRVVHTIKGAAASMGYQKTAELTHEMENLLDVYRNMRSEPCRESIDCVLNCIDTLTQMIEKIDADDNDDIDISSCSSELRKWSSADSAEKNSECPKSKKISNKNIVASISASQMKQINSRMMSENVFNISISLEENDIKSARCFLITSRLENDGDIVLTYPDIDDDNELENSQTFQVIYATALDKSEVELILLNLGIVTCETVLCTHDMFEKINPVISNNVELKDPEKNIGYVESQNNGKDLEQSSQDVSRGRISKSIRVDVQKLDDIMALFGELVINRTQLKGVIKSIAVIEEMLVGVEGAEKSLLKVRVLKSDYERMLQQSGRISGDLQEKVMKVRMMPVETVFSRFHRMTRELCGKLGKLVSLEITGEETELDKTVIEAIVDPLTHIIRNCISHGIESPDERQSMGKDRTGTINLSAKYEGNNAIIEITDDGRGINVEKIKRAAVNKGVITSEEANAMDHKSAINLIFRPSLSTTEEVNDVSGRGVGMDVVARALEDLNAMIDIQTTENEGTTFTLSFPLSLSIIQALMIESDGQVFALPMSNIHEVVKTDADNLKIVDGKNVIVLRGNVLPLVDINEVLKLNVKVEKSKEIFVVVVGWVHKKIGVIVDALRGRQELVVKSLDEYFNDSNMVEGASVLVDGTVALILSPKGIMESSVKASE